MIQKKSQQNASMCFETEKYFTKIFLKILILYSNDDTSDSFLNSKLILLENFFNHFTCNYQSEDLFCETINYVFFISTFLQEFFGLIFHFYLNLKNLNSIKKLSELLSITKITGEYNLVFEIKDYLALFDGNLRRSFRCNDNSIILNNRELFFQNILLYIYGYSEVNIDEGIKGVKSEGVSNSVKFVDNEIYKTSFTFKANKMTFNPVGCESLIFNLRELKEFFLLF